MRRAIIAGIVLTVFGVSAIVIWRMRPPAIVAELRAMPDVRSVEYAGPADAALVVVHIRDWHYVSRELCEADGIDFAANLAIVERVQLEQLAITRHFMRPHGLRVIYAEGLTEKTLPDLHLRVNLLKDMTRLAAAGELGEDARRQRREMLLEVGVVGQLLESVEVDKVMPLEDEKALDAARAGDGPRTIDARRQAIARNLPDKGIAVIVLSGAHDLTPYLPHALYVRVTPASYPE